MRTLNKYVVHGALQHGDTGPEAQSGEKVKLFLDTVANPNLPAFITGIIQHPIVRINCGNSTSYSIAYDEGDLNGAVAFIHTDDVVDAQVLSSNGEFEDLIGEEAAARIAGDALLMVNPILRTTAQGPPVNGITIAERTGQLCRVGDSTPFTWYRWDGISWVSVNTGGGGGGGSTAWDDVTGKPATFSPSAHKASHYAGGADALTAANLGAGDWGAGLFELESPGEPPGESTVFLFPRLRGDGGVDLLDNVTLVEQLNLDSSITLVNHGSYATLSIFGTTVNIPIVTPS